MSMYISITILIDVYIYYKLMCVYVFICIYICTLCAGLCYNPAYLPRRAHISADRTVSLVVSMLKYFELDEY